MPSLDHVDLIVGDIVPGANTGDSFRNPTARVLRRIEAKACRRSGNRFSFRHVFTDCRRSFYLRLRVRTPRCCAADRSARHRSVDRSVVLRQSDFVMVKR